MFCIKLKFQGLLEAPRTKCNGNCAGLPEPNEVLPHSEHDAE